MRYVQAVRKGDRTYYYFRHNGTRTPLPGDPSSPEFVARYNELLASIAVLAAPASAGSIAALITDYRRSPEFARLGPKTQESYLRALDVLQPIDRYRASDLKRAHLLALRDTLSEKPRTADLFIATARRLLSWGVDRGYLEHNPLLRVSPINEAASRVTWTDADCAAYEAAETRPAVLTAYMLGRYTGQRRGDVLAMTWAHYDGAGIEVVQSKTKARLWIPAHERLRAHLDQLPRQTLHIVATVNQTPWRGDTLAHAMRKTLLEIGRPHLSFHGLRHLAATALAEAGCSDREIMAVTGHATASMVTRYTRQADQRRRASAAILKLERKS
jgi:integrase